MYTKYYNRGNTRNTKDLGFLLDGSELSSYWTGYIFANANYYTKNGEVIGLKVNCLESEREHVERLSTYIGYKSKAVERKKGSGLYLLNVYNRSIVPILQSVGFEQSMYDRTATSDLVMTPHFWRGFADGNGLLDDDPLQFRLQLNHHLYPEWVRFIGIHTDNFHVVSHKHYREWVVTDDEAEDVIHRLYSNATIASPKMWQIAYAHITTPINGTFVET